MSPRPFTRRLVALVIFAAFWFPMLAGAQDQPRDIARPEKGAPDRMAELGEQLAWTWNQLRQVVRREMFRPRLSVVYLRFHQAEVIAEALPTILDGDDQNVSVSADRRLNSIIIRADAIRTIRLLEALRSIEPLE